jgi:RNA polymerase sigma factor (sigma-70 family)
LTAALTFAGPSAVFNDRRILSITGTARDADGRPGRSERLGAFYAEHAARLERIVARELRVPPQVIEDACQTAWTVLLRRPDVPLDRQGLAWLRKVALTTGYRAARQREQPAGGFLPNQDPGELPEPAAPARDIAEQISERLDRRTQLQALTGRERHFLALQAIGLSYSEIAAHEQTSQRTVERQLTRARRKLRQHLA